MTRSQTVLHAPGRGRRVFIETYGCQMNVADSQLMQGILETAGYRCAPDLGSADVILVNTCAVRERAEQRVLSRLGTLKTYKRDRPEVVLGVCGCMAEHLRDRLLDEQPMLDLVVGPDAYRRLPFLIDSAADGAAAVDVKLDRFETYEGVADTKADGINGWISIQRGCDKFCTFCIVPFVRGRERSAPPREVLRQARALVNQGAVEITLLGQTVNSYRYGGDGDDTTAEVDFADLLVAVEQIPGIERIRFTSPYPLDFSPKLIRTMASQPRVMPHVHLPLQSGSDSVLEQMRRGHTRADFLALVDQLRGAMPELGLTTDVIVGFPAESEDDFQQTLEVVREVRFDSAFMFMYSERSNTYAAKNIPDSVPLAVKKRRLQELIAVQEQISAERYGALAGATVQVLVKGPSRRDPQQLSGKTPCFKTVVFDPSDAHAPPATGQIVDVRIENTTSHTLLGGMIG